MSHAQMGRRTIGRHVSAQHVEQIQIRMHPSLPLHPGELRRENRHAFQKGEEEEGTFVGIAHVSFLSLMVAGAQAASRMDAAVAALTPLGFSKPMIRRTVRNLLKIYDDDAAWCFVEEANYKLVIETIVEGQENEGNREEEEVQRAEKLTSSQDTKNFLMLLSHLATFLAEGADMATHA
ncbi:hypothetical protein AXF42_Ash008239 [Apostasia shenzhenica]|uniref:WIYLD domain-containing protein n=1 Tax=Apostasia shenzhenica TaxID=1088818 RepID=A0A2I0A8Y4_9ASPA|nr:hypothetical protein AXF42_Ash008239 [Apostasia shenzhenica]